MSVGAVSSPSPSTVRPIEGPSEAAKPAPAAKTSSAKGDSFETGSSGKAKSMVEGPVGGRTSVDPDLASDLASRRASANANGPKPAVGGDGTVEVGPITQGPLSAYDRNGNKPFDLKKDAASLIANSPQVDNINETKNDSTRCGGTSVLNGLLLDGNHAKNADAIAKTANELKVPMSNDQRQAVAAMRSGSMTPKQAAHLQELVDKCARTVPGGGDEKGTSIKGLTTVTQMLRNNGGYESTSSVNYNLEKLPNGKGNHWTLTHSDNKLTKTQVNSDINSRGGATVTRDQDAPDVANPARRGKVPENFAAGITMSFDKDSTSTMITEARTKDVRMSLPNGDAVDVPTHDPDSYNTYRSTTARTGKFDMGGLKTDTRPSTFGPWDSLG